MIHNRSDYMHIQDPTGKVGEDEPVFMVRCKDKLAPGTVRIWALMYAIINNEEDLDYEDVTKQIVSWLQDHVDENCVMNDEVKQVVESVMAFADGMDEWQKNNYHQDPSVPVGTLQS